MLETPGSDGYKCSDRPRIPPELWGFVVTRLPADAQRQCLSVSRWFHDLVHPLVFAHITVHIGIWKAPDAEESHITTDVQSIKRRIIRNTELFHHIESSTRFAQIVKGMTVHAHNIGWSEEDICEPAIVKCVPFAYILTKRRKSLLSASCSHSHTFGRSVGTVSLQR